MNEIKRSIYPPKLEEYIRKNKYIPRKVRDSGRLKLYHRYWLEDYNEVVKVDDIFIVRCVEYYSIRCKSMVSCIPAPVPKYTYELLHNKEGIEKVDLINSEKSYTGAEIKYWFLMNNIYLEFGSQYAGFWSFLNPCSKTLLIDNRFYYVSYNIERRQKC